MIERITRGDVPKKHHIKLEGPQGELRHEECITRQGFDGAYSIVYHLNRPQTAKAQKGSVGFAPPQFINDAALLKRHYKTQELNEQSGSPWSARKVMLGNRDIHIGTLLPKESDAHYCVNADADQVYFILEGSGTLISPFGKLKFSALDYLVIPKGILHRIEVDSGKQHWLSLECFSNLGLPKQWRNPVGQLRMDAPFCHRDFRHSEFLGPQDETIRSLSVKQQGRFFGFELEHSPLDFVGFDGSVYPFVFPILNFQARAGLVHLPPDWHGTFSCRGALICSFVPRMVDFHPEAIPCPYPHSSVDCDEFLFYCKGNFISRRGIGPGSASFHPHGIPHGPHPGAYENSIGHQRTDELAVMVDTFEPLAPTHFATSIEDVGYQDSFR